MQSSNENKLENYMSNLTNGYPFRRYSYVRKDSNSSILGHKFENINKNQIMEDKFGKTDHLYNDFQPHNNFNGTLHVLAKTLKQPSFSRSGSIRISNQRYYRSPSLSKNSKQFPNGKSNIFTNHKVAKNFVKSRQNSLHNYERDSDTNNKSGKCLDSYNSVKKENQKFHNLLKNYSSKQNLNNYLNFELIEKKDNETLSEFDQMRENIKIKICGRQPCTTNTQKQLLKKEVMRIKKRILQKMSRNQQVEYYFKKLSEQVSFLQNEEIRKINNISKMMLKPLNTLNDQESSIVHKIKSKSSELVVNELDNILKQETKFIKFKEEEEEDDIQIYSQSDIETNVLQERKQSSNIQNKNNTKKYKPFKLKTKENIKPN